MKNVDPWICCWSCCWCCCFCCCCMYLLRTRCTYLGATSKTLARKLWGKSWKSCGEARPTKRRTQRENVPGMAWGTPGRSWDVSKTPWSPLGTSFSRDLGEKACQKARKPIFVRFCVAHVLSRDSSDVHETSILVCPKHTRSMFAAHERAHARASKKQPLRPRKSSPGAPNRCPSAPNSRSDGQVERKNAV